MSKDVVFLLSFFVSFSQHNVSPAFAFDDVADDDRMSSLDAADWLCPKYEESLTAVCKKMTTCFGNCGEFVGWRTYRRTSLVCACDALCTIYGDCCADFKKVCRSEYTHFVQQYSHLPQFETECQAGFYPAITGCSGLSEKQRKLLSNDRREPILSSKHTGLQFKGLSTYVMCFLTPQHILTDDSINAVMSNDTVQWEKRISYYADQNSIDDSFADLSKFLLKTDNVTFELLRNMPPPDITVRLCQPRVVAMCEDKSNDHQCPKKVRTHAESIDIMCANRSGIIGDDLNRETSSKAYRVEWENTTQPVLSRTTESCSMESFLDRTYKVESGKDSIHFSFIFKFNPLTNVIKLDESYQEWQMEYWHNEICNNLGISRNCDFSVICPNGYMRSGGQCIKPSGIIFQVTGKRRYVGKLNSTLELSLALLNETFDDIVHLQQALYRENYVFSSNKSDSNVVQLQTLAPIHSFEIVIGDFEKYYIEPLSKYLNITNRNQMIVHELEVCFFLIQKDVEKPGLFSCEKLQFESSYEPRLSDTTSIDEHSIPESWKSKRNNSDTSIKRHSLRVNCMIAFAMVFLWHISGP